MDEDRLPAGRKLDRQIAWIFDFPLEYICLVEKHRVEEWVDGENTWCYECRDMVWGTEKVPLPYSTDNAAAMMVFMRLHHPE